MPFVDPMILRGIPLFSLLDDQEATALAQQIDQQPYLAGQLIISAGEPGDTMFIVESGKVELFLQDSIDEHVTLSIVEPGELFGEFSLLDKAPRSASAIAVENTSLLIVDRHDLEVLVQVHPHAALDMMAMLGKRVRDANLLVRDRVARNVNEVVPQSANFGQKLSDILTAIAGDIRFVYISFFWFAIWIILNTRIIPGLEPFDPFPFGLLTMVVSLEAIFLSLFVLISQNRQAARDKVRNDVEYEVNLKAEIEVRGIMKQIETMQQLMLQHLATMNQFNLTHQDKLLERNDATPTNVPPQSNS
jgi:CRP/FNR family cyclic AMP-dependent transcriptional regulator